MRTLFFIGFGLSPVWLDLALIGYSFAVGNSNLAVVSMWLLLLAVPACAVTIGIASVTSTVHQSTKGSGGKKLLSSGAAVIFACLLVAFIAVGMLGMKENTEEALRSEAKVIESFVESDPGVISVIGNPVRTSVVGSITRQGDSLPSRYEVAAYGTTVVYAIVDVARSGSKRRLRVLCTTSTSDRDRSKDPCPQ